VHAAARGLVHERVGIEPAGVLEALLNDIVGLAFAPDVLRRHIQQEDFQTSVRKVGRNL
jgi:hypothetical protein